VNPSELSGGYGAIAPQRADKLVGYVLSLADDALISAQRMGEWIAAAPQIEEDVAVGNIALDLLGQARSLLTYAGSLYDPVHTEDDLAYFRDERDFLNVQLVERETGGDFGVAMARLLFLSTYQFELYTRLCTSTDETLAAIAAKAVKEVDYHHDHAMMWVLRLGDGTEESHMRMQAALDAEWPYVDELFDNAHIDPSLLQDAVAVDPAQLRDGWQKRVGEVLAEATLILPDVPPAVTGGRRGVHSTRMGFLLAEMQHLARSHPGATW
jgi:ring-1,2-phenylacetyl-CoA epoxidase subunit PaaC